MVLHRLSSSKRLKQEMEKTQKKKNRRIKESMQPAKMHNKDEMKALSSHVCKSVCRTMMEETRQQMNGTLKALALIGAPAVLLQLVCLIYKCNSIMCMNIDMCEYFAGCMAVTRCFSRVGFISVPYEIKLDQSHMDILSPLGLATALTIALRIKRGGFAMLATVCSSWVFISRSQSRRSIWQPLGDRSVKFVENGNVMVARMCLVLWILLSKDIVWLYEQPSSSLLWHHPRMEDMIKHFDIFRCFTWMGSYGADSPKGTVLWSNRAGVKMPT